MPQPKVDVEVIEKDPNVIEYDSETGMIAFGEHTLTPQQLALVADNMRVSLKELGYEATLSVKNLKSISVSSDATTTH